MAPDPPHFEYEFRHKTRFIYPLLYIPISDLPISVKVALCKKAIRAGADVNQLDPTTDPRWSYGRPLNFAVEYTRANLDYLKDNIPVIKLLLKHGADPRLSGPLRTRSALDEMRDMAQWGISDKDPQYWNEVVPFFKEAFRLMDQAAKKLDRRDARKARVRAVLDRFSCSRQDDDDVSASGEAEAHKTHAVSEGVVITSVLETSNWRL
ncbi:hypothetical protein B7463_g12466, partial [Scytalidium lignicola]